MSSYDRIARYYDLWHAQRHEDISFWTTAAAETGGPILELGCGAGRLMLPLTADGYRVVGVDHSPRMLALAREKLAAAVPTDQWALVAADMAAFALAERFALIFIPYNTLMHLEDDQFTAVLRRAHEHAVPGGRLILDVANPHLLALADDDAAAVEEHRFYDPQRNQTVRQLAAYTHRPEEQRLHITWSFKPVGGMGADTATLTADYHYRYPHQLHMALAAVGWRVRDMVGDYDGRPFAEHTERLILTAEKNS